MYGTVSYGPVNQEVDEIDLRLFCSRVCAKAINVIPIVGYFVLLSLRFIGLIIYFKYTAIDTGCYTVQGTYEQDPYATEPTNSGPYIRPYANRCYDLTKFRYPKELIVVWMIASVMNTFLVVLVLVRVPGYDGYLPTLRENAKHARFWSLLLQLLLSITDKVFVALGISPKASETSEFLVMSFIMEETLTTFAVFVWNGVPAPWKNPRVPAKYWAYRLTLLVFLLEKLLLFLLTFLHAASSAKNSDDFNATALNAADATFFYSLTKFFWNKLFYGEKNLLINDNV